MRLCHLGRGRWGADHPPGLSEESVGRGFLGRACEWGEEHWTSGQNWPAQLTPRPRHGGPGAPAHSRPGPSILHGGRAPLIRGRAQGR